MNKKKIVIVGGGPGGVTNAMILASRGFDVTLYEKKDKVGGRNGCYEIDGYKFDVGPTFLMMKFLLDHIFEDCGLNSEDYMNNVELDTLYEVYFGDKVFKAYSDNQKTAEEIERLFPGSSRGIEAFLANEEKRLASLLPCLQKDYSSWHKLMSVDTIKALPYLSLGKSVFQILKKYFDHDDLALLFSFQSKYLGMSAWDCPGGFSMLSYIEHAHGIFHTMGGLSEISASIARAAEDLGAKIKCGEGVKEILIENKQVKGVLLESGEKVFADDVVLNADFAHAMEHLIPSGKLKKYTPKKLDKMKYSCSTFMMYLGMDKVFDLPHHTIVFAKDYKQSIQEIFKDLKESYDISFYVRNASVTDDSLAPEGCSSLYILVPTPNLDADIDWEQHEAEYRARVIAALNDRLGIDDFEKHIVVEKRLTPQDWSTEFDVAKGATFNLAHSLDQMAIFRPRNKFEEFKNCYLVGGGTHPGSGLPTIFESARISANLISKSHKVNYDQTPVTL